MKFVFLTMNPKLFTTTNWITIICALLTALISIICILISYALGQRTYFKNIKIKNDSERYQKFYLPLLKIIYYQSDENGIHLIAFYNHQRQELYRNSLNNIKDHRRARNLPYNDEIVNFVMNNLKYATPELLTKCLEYSKFSTSIFKAANYDRYSYKDASLDSESEQKMLERANNELRKRYEAETIEAIDKFIPLIGQILEETQELSKCLQSTDLTLPLQKSLKLGRQNSDILIKELKESTDFERTLNRVIQPY